MALRKVTANKKSKTRSRTVMVPGHFVSVVARTSSATRAATLIAATRRGCVQPMRPDFEYPASCRYCGICGRRILGQLRSANRRLTTKNGR